MTDASRRNMKEAADLVRAAGVAVTILSFVMLTLGAGALVSAIYLLYKVW